MTERYAGQAGVEAAETVPASAAPDAGDPSSYAALFRLAVPLILSMTGLMLMHMLDRIFLGRYSEAAVAAAAPAGMSAYLLMSPFLGVAGYTSTFVAQYVGAGRPGRVGAAVWQGLYVALGSGVAVAALSVAGPTLMRLAGHDPDVTALEVRFFRITCWGAPLALLASALSGFFAGRGDTATLMKVQVGGFLLNAALAYGLIFGRLGLPEWGCAGAATATVAAQGFNAAVLSVLFFGRRHRRAYGTWTGRGPDADLLRRLTRFGLPAGARFFVELLAWTVFLFFVGRLGRAELAVTNIVWAINGLAFFPAIGLASAVGTLVGQSLGRGRPDWARRCIRRGLWVAESYTLAAAAVFVLAPETLLDLFRSAERPQPELLSAGTILLRFVALYCLLDGANIVILSALQGAGDTRWTLAVSLALHAGFLAVLMVLDFRRSGLHAEWVAATAFIMVQAGVWLARFRAGAWERMRVIEPDVLAG